MADDIEQLEDQEEQPTTVDQNEEDGSYLMSRDGKEEVYGNAYVISDGQICKIKEDEMQIKNEDNY